MNDTPIQIRNPKIVRAIRELAAKTGRPISEAVGEVVLAELARRQTADQEGYESRLAGVREISRKFRELPVIGPRLTDNDLYDEYGLPR
jgi:hypothetical protein